MYKNTDENRQEGARTIEYEETFAVICRDRPPPRWIVQRGLSIIDFSYVGREGGSHPYGTVILFARPCRFWL